MDILDIIIIIFAVYLFYYLINKNEFFTAIDYSNNEKYKKKFCKNIKQSKKKINESYYLDNMKPNNTVIKNNYSGFSDVKFHDDYRDILSTFNVITTNKQLFNNSNYPINETHPSKNKIKKLTKKFLDELNSFNEKYITQNVNPSTGWNEVLSYPNMKSGWDKQMEKLGIPGNLYKSPSIKSNIDLKKLLHYESFESENDIRISIYLIMKKNNSKDSIVIKVNFFIDKNNVNKDRNFFKDNEDTDSIDSDHHLDVVIEQIYTIGFLINSSDDKLIGDNFYNYDNIEKSNITDQNDIINQLNNKVHKRYLEAQETVDNLDYEEKKNRNELTNIDNIFDSNCD